MGYKYYIETSKESHNKSIIFEENLETSQYVIEGDEEYQVINMSESEDQES